MAVDWDSAVLAPLMDVFGEPATYSPAAGSSFPVEGVFDEAYHEIEMIDETTSINTARPVFGVRTALFATPPLQGDRIWVASVNTTYVVRDVQPDGHGEVKLMLNFVSSP